MNSNGNGSSARRNDALVNPLYPTPIGSIGSPTDRMISNNGNQSHSSTYQEIVAPPNRPQTG